MQLHGDILPVCYQTGALRAGLMNCYIVDFMYAFFGVVSLLFCTVHLETCILQDLKPSNIAVNENCDIRVRTYVYVCFFTGLF